MNVKTCFIYSSVLALALAVGCSKREGAPEQSKAAPASSPSQAQPSASTQPALATSTQTAPAKLLPQLKAFADTLPKAFDDIPADRKAQLDKLALFLKTRLDSGQPARVLFICTHNSRRSHMGQTAATLAAAYYGIKGIEAYSGGTEATAFNPRAVAALERLGYDIQNPGGKNPHYELKYAQNRPPMVAFSKKYDDPFNPKQDFAAVMTCDHADKNCPTVAGATLRIPLHFVDPKESDGTPNEAETYDARAKQIATEVFYAMSRVKS